LAWNKTRHCGALEGARPPRRNADIFRLPAIVNTDIFGLIGDLQTNNIELVFYEWRCIAQ
jgi:hypothetical protein